MEYEHQLSEEQFATVGRIIMNWGAADSFLGHALSNLYQIFSPHAQRDLLTPLDMKKKADLLQKRVKDLGRPEELNIAVAEIQKVIRLWSEERNVLAHGGGIGGAEGILISSGKRQSEIPVVRLDQILARSEYVLSVAIRINFGMIGRTFGPDFPLPNRPV